MTPSNGMLLSDGELDHLARKLDGVGEIFDRLATLGPMSRMGVSGPQVQSQPRSRPPYNLGAQGLIDELCNEISTTVRHICEHRRIDVEPMGIEASAAWLRKHRTGIAVMADAEEIYENLIKVIDRCAGAVGLHVQEYHVNDALVEQANRFRVSSVRAEKLAYKLGDQAKGLNRNRVDYLRRAGHLSGEWDDEAKCWMYLLGDVLAAHKRAREVRRRGKVAS